MKLFHYIHAIDDSECLAFTTSPDPIAIDHYNKSFQLSETDLIKYRIYIKYIDCCTLGDNNTLQYDYMKILSKKLNQLSLKITKTIIDLRKLLVEASALNKLTVVTEIVQTIKALNEFRNNDFSGIKDITQIENITCPELHIDYNKYYESKIYEI